MFKSIFGLLALIAIVAISSCSSAPGACYIIEGQPNSDTIHRNVAYTFNGSCSADAHEYDWVFRGLSDSLGYGAVQTRTYPDSGTFDILMIVTNGNNYNTIDQPIVVIR